MGDLGVVGRIILKLMVEKQFMKFQAVSSLPSTGSDDRLLGT
jgi:hypothetical protein